MQSNARATLLYDGVYTLGVRIANAAAAVVLGILTARVLGPAGRGVYALPMVEAGLVSTAFTGLTGATSYFMLNRGAGRAVLRAALLMALLAVTLGGCAVVVLCVFTHALWASAAAVAALPATAVNCIVSGYAVGVKRVRAVTTLSVATTLTNLILVGAGFLVFGRAPAIAIMAWIATLNVVALTALIVMWLHARRIAPGQSVELGSFGVFALKVGGTNLVSLLNYRGDLYIVALLGSLPSLGLYSVAVSASETILVATQSAAIAISPHVGSMEHRAAATLTARCVRNNLLLALCFCGALFVLAPWIVFLLYGAAFTTLVPALRILLVGVVALSLGSPVSSYFTLKLGKPEIPLWLSSLSAALCIALAAVLVQQMGIVGAAIASSAAYIIGQGLGLVVFSREARIGLKLLLLPTTDDAAFYVRLVRQLLSDGSRLLHGDT